MMTIMVTGGAGFIGSNFILNWLKEHNELVVTLDKLTYAGNIKNLSTLTENVNHVFVQGDICDIELTGHLLSTYAPRAVINFAAESHVDRSIQNPESFIQTNIVGTYRLLETVKSYWHSLGTNDAERFRFLHVSTDEVYGSLSANADPFTEENRYEPNSPYSASKASSDHLVRAYHHTYGLPVITTNCSNNYGPYQYPEKLIPLLIHNALSAKPLPVYGDGLQVRDWLFVGDHCSAIRAVLDGGKCGEVYNVGGLNEKANIDVVREICDVLDEMKPIKYGHGFSSYHDLICHVEDRPGHDRRYAIDATKIETQLNWRPEESFETGIRKTIQWYIANQSWTEDIFSRQR